MTIDLPDSFSYSGLGRIKAYREENDLIIEGNITSVDFEQLMYQVTYATKDTTKCFYCGETLVNEEQKMRSLDHIYAKLWGGISLPCNLVPACVRCNLEKGTLTGNQYLCWKNSRRRSQDKLKSLYLKKNKHNSKCGSFLPEEWITYTPIDQFSIEEFGVSVFSKAYTEVSEFYEKHRHYLRPIILSKNGFVLYGKTSVAHALNNEVKMIPTIILDNVLVRRRI